MATQTKSKSKGVSLAKGLVGLIGMALLAFGVLANGGRGGSVVAPSGSSAAGRSTTRRRRGGEG